MKRHASSTKPAQLRRSAEAQLRKQKKHQRSKVIKAKSSPPVLETDSQRQFHELQVHQVELEMQNDELQKVREDMEAALEQYTDLYDFAPVGYFTLASDSTVQQANLTGASLVGIERSRLVGRCFDQLFPAGVRPAFRAFLQQVFAGQTKRSGDFEMLHPGQPSRSINIKAQRSFHEDSCRVAVVDITERKQAEDKVRVSEIRYRRLFETAHDGVLLLNPATRKITDANPFMTKLLAYPHDQLVGKELFEIGLLKDESASQEMFQKLKHDHEVRYEDLPLESKGGRHQEVEVVANLYQENGHAVIQCNIRDIKARKQAEELLRRSEALAVTNLKLESELVLRQVAGKTLQQNHQHQHQLLEQTRHFARDILRVQEEERQTISRELHDVIAQTLTGINIQLTALKKEAALNLKGFDRSITRTQKLVEHSVNVVHEFARELRPAVLDDLGLIPALHSFVKIFSQRTHLHVALKAFAGVEQLDSNKRTVLFRVAQEALTNVARHAKASRVEVNIQKLRGGISMKITDDGKSFNVERALPANGGKRLGLIGMRERVEMVGGKFTVASAPGQGTTIEAYLPLTKGKRV